MSKFKILNTVSSYIDDSCDTAVEVTTISVNARERHRILRTNKSRWEFIEHLTREGIIRTHGCDCSHCLNDWDCCGRMTLDYTAIEVPRHGLRINQFLSRNI